MSKEQAISELEAVINKVWSRTKTTSPLLEAIYSWHERESTKAVIEELQDALSLWSSGETKEHVLNRIKVLKKQIGEE